MSDPQNYTVGWICALEVECLAAKLLLDNIHPGLKSTSPADNNTYTLGEMSGHHIAIAVLPLGEYGLSSATRVAADMQHTFKNIRIGLMVGIGGGAPYLEKQRDIRLGDVVVSTSINGKSSVLQYDFGKNNQAEQDDFELTGSLNQPPRILQSAVHQLKANYKHYGHKIEDTIQRVVQNKDRHKHLRRPDSKDRLYKSEFVHPAGSEGCEITCEKIPNVIRRPRRPQAETVTIHYGRIASANSLMKNALKRDQLAKEEDILCFEMEAAGLMNHFPCLVVRGICDYSDSHKNKEWQGYAAMTAAVYAKDLLLEIAPAEVTNEKKISDILSDLQRDVGTIAQDLEKIANNRPKNKAILDWITPVDHAPQQADLFNRRVSGTGRWFLNSNQYQTWRDKPDQTLSCQGIPGAGKTIIAATVVNNLFDEFENETTVGIAYLYLNFQRPKEQRLEALISSVLKQLLQGRELPSELIELYLRYKKKPAWPTVNELFEVLQVVATKCTKIFIVIDALDESSFPNELKTFLTKMIDLRFKCVTNIFTTSRPNTQILKQLPKDSSDMIIRASESDVERYIDEQMSILPDFVSECEILQFTVKFKILDAIDGMFLLAHIFLNALVGAPSRKALETALDSLLDTSKGDVYDMAYNSAMDRIEAQPTRDIAKQVLLWVSRAHRPIRMLELRHALGIEIGTSHFSEDNVPEIDLISICAGLVTIEEKWFRDGEDRKVEFVRLVHHTTQEYFDNTWFIWFPDADMQIVNACITYMSYDIFSTGICETQNELNTRLEAYPFYRFAAWCWGHHVQLANMQDDPVVLAFLENENLVGSCSQAMLHSRYGFENLGRRPTLESNQALGPMSGLGLAVILGLETAVTQLLLRGADIEMIDGWLRTPLCWAAWSGNERMVRMLWYKKAHIDSKNISYVTPLALASQQGHTELVKLFIAKGASIKPKRGPQPLHLAAECGNEETVKLLLDAGADIHSKDKDGLTSLSLAISTNNQKPAEFLLSRGAKVNTRDIRGNTPLCWAIMARNFEMVQLLLQKGAKMETRNENGQTPLLVAVRFNRKGIVRLLLSEGAYVDAKDDVFGQTPLSWAAAFDNREGVMDRLIERGADFEAVGKEGKTALILAVERGQALAVEKLLERGADIETPDSRYGRSPLLWAVCRNSVPMFNLLVQSGANLDAIDYKHRTALKLAFKFASDKIIPLLLDLRGEQITVSSSQEA